MISIRKNKQIRRKAFKKRQEGWKKTRVSGRRRKTRSASSYSFASIASMALAVLLVVGAMYVLYFSSFFRIENIIVENDGAIVPSEDIVSRVEQVYSQRSFLLFSQQNIFLFPVDDVEKGLLSDFSSIYYASIDKDFPNVLRISIKERQPVFLWKQNETFYFIADDAVATHQATELEVQGSSLPIVESMQGQDVVLGETVTNARVMKFVALLEDVFTSKTGFDIESYSLPSSRAAELNVKIVDGPQIFFNLENTAESQLENLVLVIEEELSGNISGLEYIDMRVGSWVYYK